MLDRSCVVASVLDRPSPMNTFQDRRVAQAIEAMERRIDVPWRVQELADLADLSASRFAHLFRRAVGVSPARYLQQLRMRRASDLLARTSLPVAEVMRLVGCPDPSHFARNFRDQFGIGPSEYRRSHGKL
jgi:transcriptional regulator GlxA family with amidase domain